MKMFLTRRRCAPIALLLGAAALALSSIVGVGPLAATAGAATPAPTTSHYEANASVAALLGQGQEAGKAGSQGLVILDFGRPAAEGPVSGTMDFDNLFVSLATIGASVTSYIRGYFATAPSYLHLDVAIGTNNSCGTGQPCGAVVCGCTFEPPSFEAWGVALATEVEQVQSQAQSIKAHSGYTDTVTVMAGDDVEPAFDPSYQNTHDLLAGYQNEVGGFTPAMVDFGSADPGFWSDAQLLQVADGFRPDLAVPEIYSAVDASLWGSLASYARAHGRELSVFGVLTAAPAGNSPQVGYSSLIAALQPITGQGSLRWPSNIRH
jgi:hypothetical protein